MLSLRLILPLSANLHTTLLAEVMMSPFQSELIIWYLLKGGRRDEFEVFFQARKSGTREAGFQAEGAVAAGCGWCRGK
jgi:hypothetical protein